MMTAMRYVVSIKINQKHVCFGSLLSKNHVLSSASCAFYIFRCGGEFFEHATVFITFNRALTDGGDYGIRMIEHYPTYRPEGDLSESGFDLSLIMVSPLIYFDFGSKIIRSKLII